MSNPIGKTPVYIHHNISAEESGHIELEVLNRNFNSGKYAIALCVGDDVERTVYAYTQLDHGDAVANMSCAIQLQKPIIQGQTGVKLKVKYDVLDGVEPNKNGDTLCLYDISKKSEITLAGYYKIQSNLDHGFCEFEIDKLYSSEQLSIGYYRGNFLGACAAQQEVVIENIN